MILKSVHWKLSCFMRTGMLLGLEDKVWDNRPVIGYPAWSFLRFSSVPLGTFWDSTLRYATAASFLSLSKSAFIKHTDN